MKSKAILGILLSTTLLASCGGGDGETAENQTADTPAADQAAMVGGETDAHGCQPGTGHTWSYALRQCVAKWETGHKMKLVEGAEDKGISVIFSADFQQVEVNNAGPDSLVLNLREPHTYTADGYALTTNGGKCTLVINGKDVYETLDWIPAEESPAVIAPQDVMGGPSYIAFQRDGETLFYYHTGDKKGAIKVNGKDYTLNKYSYEEPGTYKFSGPGITIVAPDGKHLENTGEDCFYGSFHKVSIVAGGKEVNLANISVQNCGNY